MSRLGGKRPRKEKLEPRLSLEHENRTPSKRPRRSGSPKTAAEECSSPTLELTAPASPNPPVNFSIRVEIESCDEDWSYEEDTQSSDTKQNANSQTQNDGENSSSNRHDKDSNNLYLESANFKHGIFESMQQSNEQPAKDQKLKVVAEKKCVPEKPNVLPENQIKLELLDKFSIKHEVLDEDLAQTKVVNLTEDLGITIKEEPLEELVYKVELTESKHSQQYEDSLCTIEADYRVCRNVDDTNVLPYVNQLNGFEPSAHNVVENMSAAETLTWRKKLKICNSRYFDISLKKAVDHLDDVNRLVCKLCLKTFTPYTYGLDQKAADICMEDFRCHMNCLHSEDSLVFKANKRFSTIVAVKVCDTNKEYMKLITEAWRYVYWSNRYLQSIISSLVKTTTKSKWQILSYKCYACRLTYENLSSFLEHLSSNHKSEIKISTEMIRSVFVNVRAAYTERKFKEDFPVVRDDTGTLTFKCLECKTDFRNDKEVFEAHKRKKETCKGCSRKFFCYQMHSHIGQCDDYLFNYYPKTCPCGEISENKAAADDHQKGCIDSLGVVSFNCIVCSFRAPSSQLLKEHQALCHLVRTDTFIIFGNTTHNTGYEFTAWSLARIYSQNPNRTTLTPGQAAEKPSGSSLADPLSQEAIYPPNCTPKTGTQTAKRRTRPDRLIVPLDPMDIAKLKHAIETTHICPVCFKKFATFPVLENHATNMHLARSDHIVMQEVSSCKFCYALYPGPVSTHDCPCQVKKEPCPFCGQKFLTSSLLACHLKGQSRFLCAKCKEVLQYECLKVKHRAICGDGISKRVNPTSGIKSQGFEEKTGQKSLLKEDTVPVIRSSADPIEEHCYATTVPNESDEVNRLNKTDIERTQNLNGSQNCEITDPATENALDDISDDEDTLTINTNENEENIVEIYELTNRSRAKSKKEVEAMSNDVELVGRTFVVVNKDDAAALSNEDLDKNSGDEKLIMTKEKPNELHTNERVISVENFELTNSSSLKSDKEMQGPLNEEEFIIRTIKKEPVDHSEALTEKNLNELNAGEKKSEEVRIPIYFKGKLEKIEEEEVENKQNKNEHHPDLGVKFIVTGNKRSLLRPLPFSEYMKAYADNIKKEPKTDLKLIEVSKAGPDKEDHPKSGAAIEIMIKPEPIDFEEEFVVTKTENIDAEVSIEDFIANNSEIEAIDLIGIEPEVLLRENIPRVRNRTYKCSNCNFQSTHARYARHRRFCRRAKAAKQATQHQEKKMPFNFLYFCTSFKCSVCSTEHRTLRKYRTHKCARTNTCPHCDTYFKPNRRRNFLFHLQSIIRLQFVGVYSLDNAADTEFRKYFGCVECKASVEKEEVFNHWESHRYADNFTVTKAEPKDATEFPAQVTEDAIPAEMMEEMLNTLQSRERKKDKVCAMCTKLFNRDHDLKRHLIEHLIRDAYAKKRTFEALRCQICSADHKTLIHYKRHMRDHGRMPLYQCHICDKTFSDSSNFAKHKKVHNLKVKICDYCSKKFHSKLMLIKHIELHSTLTPISCQHCPMTFLFGSQHRRHVKNRHRVEKGPYACRVCKMKVPSMKDKWNHEWEAHGERNQEADCPECGEQFRKYSDVKRHMGLQHGRLMRKKTDLKLSPLQKKVEERFSTTETNYNFLREAKHS